MVPLLAPTSLDNCLTRNDWICGLYYSTRAGDLQTALVQHIGIVLASVSLGLVVAIPLALVARRYRRLEGIIVGTTTAIYTIPSLALFSLMVPFTGLGHRTVLIGLGLYSLTILVRAVLDGLDAVPDEVRESALGMGYNPRTMLLRVEVPLAVPAFMSGLRVAMVSAVALTTVGSILDYGGLGNLILEDPTFKAQVLAGSVLCVALAVSLDIVLVVIQRLLTPWTRA
ncbi:MAG: binding-protein-dependent transport system inner rane component [Marmoricola sp.]|nr:binding-protein-dependent transport system inner rane component [Marmoricola sp.]